MIASRVRGGLGNQLFEYAAGRGVAEILGTDLYLDLSDYESAVTRTFLLGHLNCKYKIMDSALFSYDHVPKLSQRLKNIFLRKWKLVPEKQYHFDESILKVKKGSYLAGYWQSEKYFLHIRDQLLEELRPREPLDGRNLELAGEIAASHSVSIHVRRTDYLAQHTLKFHGVMSPEYYEQGLEHISRRVPDLRVFVFSDDLEWCRYRLKISQPVTFVENSQSNPIPDLVLMSMCRHNIIANSTFSWWGAWLNRNPDKIVVAPKNWILDSQFKTDDVLPDSWIKI